MPKSKPNKGLLKRIKITKSGKIKLHRAFGRHRRSHKSGTLLQKYRRPKLASHADVGRIRAMLFTTVKAAKARSVEATADADQA